MSGKNKQKPLPSLGVLSDCFELDGDCPSGLRWRIRTEKSLKSNLKRSAMNKQFAGKPAGSKTSAGYYFVRVLGQTYYAHRVVYALCNKTIDFAHLFVDHIDRNKRNNRAENLRLADHSLNMWNRDSKNTSSGYCNISRIYSNQKWNVRFLNNDGKRRNKAFDKLEHAVEFQQTIFEYGWEG